MGTSLLALPEGESKRELLKGISETALDRYKQLNGGRGPNPADPGQMVMFNKIRDALARAHGWPNGMGTINAEP
jgi:hypothetical protein